MNRTKELYLLDEEQDTERAIQDVQKIAANCVSC